MEEDVVLPGDLAGDPAWQRRVGAAAVRTARYVAETSPRYSNYAERELSKKVLENPAIWLEPMAWVAACGNGTPGTECTVDSTDAEIDTALRAAWSAICGALPPEPGITAIS